MDDPSTAENPETDPPFRPEREIRNLVLLVGLAAVVRVAFLLRMELASFDPWRHLKLIDNLRAGRGFTLFEGQPYIWYHPAWYHLCALVPARIGPQWLAGLLSALSVGALYLWMRRSGSEGLRRAAPAAAFMMAAFGPLVTFTCHYGSESFALFLPLAALAAVGAAPGVATAAAGGLLFGVAVAARLSLAFDALLFLPALRRRATAVAFVAGGALPLLLTWWRNHRAIATHPYLFTWDGLATRAADFGPVSTLFLQKHPAVEEGLRRLHLTIAPLPQWLSDLRGFAWDMSLFMLVAVAALIACRSFALGATGLLTLAYFQFFDPSLSAHFLRIHLGLFPVLLAAIAVSADRWRRPERRWGAAPTWVAALLVIGLGRWYLSPPPIGPLEYFTPPAELLTEDAYLVNSSFLHPESLLYRFPEKRFIGMPLDPEQFADFRSRFPGYRSVLLHEFGVQAELESYLEEEGGFAVSAEGANRFGRRYRVLTPASPEVRP